MSVNQTPGFVKPREHTFDAFLGGKLSIAQPQKGFRAGIDSVLVGASVPQSARTLLDLGAGAGVAALTAMAYIPSLSATLVDSNPEMVALAHENAKTNQMSARCQTMALDATSRASERAAAGLARDHFDVVIANPPFFASGTLASQPARAAARHMAPQDLDLWIRTALAHAKGRGEVIFIHTAEALPLLMSGFTRAMGDVAVLPIAPRAGAPASRVLIGGRKGSRAPFTLLPPLVVHEGPDQAYSARVEAIFRGRGALDWRNATRAPT